LKKGAKTKTTKPTKAKAPAAKAASAKKPAVKKAAPAKKAAPVKKAQPKKAEVKKTAVKKPAAQNPAAKKAVVKKPVVKKPEAKKSVPAKAVAKKAEVKKPVAKVAPKKVDVKKTIVKTPVVKPAPAAKAAPVKVPAKVAPKIVPKIAVRPVPAPVIIVPRKKVPSTNATILPPDYDLSKDKGDFMNPVMSEYFRQKLIRWREELLRESTETIQVTLQGTELQKPDLADRASAETDHALELRTRDRERKLISKINEAILRIEDGTYGYCEETGEPITVARLDARPIATLSIEAQERHERLERTHRDE
jgi:DnaK suppressor protein